MSSMRKIWRFLILAGGAGGLLLALSVGGIAAWEYSNSSDFCAKACHGAHPEEPDAYRDSYHSQVECVECHLGRISTLEAVLVKASHMRHVWAMLTGFERPVTSYSMQTSSASCERCHTKKPQRFDSIRVHKRYAEDAANTETEVHLVLHTGVDTLRFTGGKNIHWHVNVPVRFVSTDPLRQNIPWLEVIHPDGRSEVFQDVTQPLTAQQLAALPKREMDCLDCHNRVGHPFHNPEEVVDQAIADGRLDRSLPYLKARALGMLEQGAANREDAERLIDASRERYERDYPEIAQRQPEAVAGAAAFMREMRGFMLDLVTRSGFEDESVSWRSFPDNKGHKDFPGCFRCHSGKHANAAGEVIRLQCGLCHSIPTVVLEGQEPQPIFTAAMQQVPEGHRDPDFVAEHRYMDEKACAGCHGELEFGDEGGGFCSNSACHGRSWPNVDLDALSE